MVDPARIIGRRAAQAHAFQILTGAGEPYLRQAERCKHALGQRLLKCQAGDPLNQSGHEQVADIGIVPVRTGFVTQPGSIETLQHVVCRPRCFVPADGCVVMLKLAVIREPGLMTQELAQSERAFTHAIIQPDQSIADQCQRSCRQHRLGKTPPGHHDIGLSRCQRLTVRDKGNKHGQRLCVRSWGDSTLCRER